MKCTFAFVKKVFWSTVNLTVMEVFVKLIIVMLKEKVSVIQLS